MTQPDDTDQSRSDQAQVRSRQDSLAMNQGMRVLSYLISGVVLYGGLGWVGDHFLHTRFLLPIGILVGAALGIYLTIKMLGAAEAAPVGAATKVDDVIMNGVTEGER